MLELARQAAVEAGRQSSIVVAIPIGAAASVVSVLIIKATDYVFNRRNGKAKPGEAETCRKHGEELARLGEFKELTYDALERIERKVDKLLEK